MAGKLSIVIDDFGYRPHNENQVLNLPAAISVAVLPNAPYAREMATKAHNQGREVLIHLPMAPMSKQPLERDTLRPDMSGEEIQRIIRQSVNNVPYAVGLNNHMGSAMTADLPGMQKVMQALSAYQLYFLDSMTIGSSKATQAAAGTGVKVIKRKVFLDDSQNEADIRRQFNRAVQIARRSGSAIAIGHPHPSTIKVLQQMLPALDADIVLVRPSQLLNEPTWHYEPSPAPETPKPVKPRNPFRGIKQCLVKRPPEPVKNDVMFKLVDSSIRDSAAITFVKRRWQTWVAPAESDVRP
ncbi:MULTISPECIES: divergent polysaccharide deacetylase family protein [unclassified Brenneria]|uniref:divergent polysaccharide deacetylase family protein n=1 Tax=unclassified Brenneria TaxID=2634434 RepID=UPI0015564CDE|nr:MULTISPECIES: divergent polysaccharide deacetylase family protein [unclassified Brenneria]MBJ7223416.1 divergent polysaccharide deacetylase family protein [Brenneria sp. L3-3C-1]MEE3644656.1 divergent polysaccharide deacetylase family protein [Brenneria sp. L3_3C_1]MEE3652218.1 divergent polysaccharide deacetylase family protein [Brenneria sp. HEZEL_4_2_4]NPD02177.1 divergent polysaccharide deacetylase family protein [Brenneria sp. hezel4-2-4]